MFLKVASVTQTLHSAKLALFLQSKENKKLFIYLLFKLKFLTNTTRNKLSDCLESRALSCKFYNEIESRAALVPQF